MKRRLILFAATLLMALAATFSGVSPTNSVAAQGASCQAQCKVAYNTCVRNATNPGGLNHCRKAYTECTGNCG